MEGQNHNIEVKRQSVQITSAELAAKMQSKREVSEIQARYSNFLSTIDLSFSELRGSLLSAQFRECHDIPSEGSGVRKKKDRLVWRSEDIPGTTLWIADYFQYAGFC